MHIPDMKLMLYLHIFQIVAIISSIIISYIYTVSWMLECFDHYNSIKSFVVTINDLVCLVILNIKTNQFLWLIILALIIDYDELLPN